MKLCCVTTMMKTAVIEQLCHVRCVDVPGGSNFSLWMKPTIISCGTSYYVAQGGCNIYFNLWMKP